MTSGRCAWAAARRQFADRETDEGGSIGFFGGAVPCPRCPGGMSPPAGDLQKSVLIGTAPRQFFATAFESARASRTALFQRVAR